MEFSPQQHTEQEPTVLIPSLETLHTISQFLPPIGVKFSLVERAGDFEETPEDFLAILNCLKRMGAIDYSQDGDQMTLTRREVAGNVSPAAYFEIFVNPRTRDVVNARLDIHQEEKSA